jgi:phosphodiesterase/alkaline phosphatase D-like protein
MSPHDDALNAATTTRRRFLSATGAAAALAVAGTLPGLHTAESATRDTRFRTPLFTLGIASGDPLPDGVVIWTRLAPQPLEPFGGMDRRIVPVLWEVAEDEAFRRVVRRGTAHARPEYSHTVHVDVRGLRPWRHYFFRFRAGGQLSPVGRTRTAPAAHGDIAALSLAVASCQLWRDGFYSVYSDLVARDHDLVFFLGDYIYEVGVGGGPRGNDVPEEQLREAYSLDEYRGRYALYKTDPDLQAAHAVAPWVVTLDDHEVENNWAGAISQDNVPEAEFLIRRANAFRAYWEHMPLRLDQAPSGPSVPLYRRLRYGAMAEFSVLDTRQYRSDQVGDGGWNPPSATADDPARTITGAEQERWLLGGLGTSTARWNVLAQQVAMTRLDREPGAEVEVPMDTWDGYTASRRRVLGGAHERGVRNLVAITGDLHRSVAGDLKPDFADPASPTVGAEFITTSVSSGGDGSEQDATGRALLESEHIKHHRPQRGYLSCRVDATAWTSEFRVIDNVSSPGAAVSSAGTFAVENGRPGVQTA